LAKTHQLPKKIIMKNLTRYFFIIQSTLYLILTFLFLSKNYSFDAIGHSLVIEQPNADLFFHPYHLLYTPILYCFYQILLFLKISISGLLAGQIFSIISAIFCIYLIYKIADALFDNAIIKISCAALVNFSYWFWYYSMDAELHLPNMFILLLISYNILRYIQTSQKINFYIAVTLCGLAPAFHQVNLMIFISALFLLTYTADTLKNKISVIIKFCTALFCFTIIPYLFCAYYFLKIKNFQTLMTWLTRYQQKGYWSNVTTNYFADTLKGLSYALFGGGTKKIILLIFIISIVLIFQIYFLKRKQKNNFRLFLILLTILYSAVVIYWHPNNPENWWALVFILFLFSEALDKILTTLKNQKIKFLIFAFIVILAIYQFYAVFFGYIKKYSREKNNKYFIATQTLKKLSELNNNAFILTLGAGEWTHLNIYLPYFAKNNFATIAAELDNNDLINAFDNLEKKINDYQRVILFSDLTNKEAIAELAMIHKITYDLLNYKIQELLNKLSEKNIIKYDEKK